MKISPLVTIVLVNAQEDEDLTPKRSQDAFALALNAAFADYGFGNETVYDYYNATNYEYTDYEPIGRGKKKKNKEPETTTGWPTTSEWVTTTTSTTSTTSTTTTTTTTTTSTSTTTATTSEAFTTTTFGDYGDYTLPYSGPDYGSQDADYGSQEPQELKSVMDQLYEGVVAEALESKPAQPQVVAEVLNNLKLVAMLPSGEPSEEEIRLSQQPDFIGFCWSCSVQGDPLNAKQACLDQGHMAACSTGSNRCQSTIRKRGGIVTSVQMGCQQAAACNQEERSNFELDRCHADRVSIRSHSVCSSCCNPKKETNCNLLFVDGAHWDPTEDDYRNLA